jgi:hypothetical protein
MFWMEAVPSIAFVAGVLFIPESPRFLIAHGRRNGNPLLSHAAAVAGLAAANLYITAFAMSWGP